MAAPPIPNSTPSCSPAVPPPPVAGAPAGIPWLGVCVGVTAECVGAAESVGAAECVGAGEDLPVWCAGGVVPM